jgi:hypothetical protein
MGQIVRRRGTPLQFATKSNQGRSKTASRERLLNLFPEIQLQGSETPVAVYATPGMKPIQTFINSGDLRIRGLDFFDRRLFSVTESNLYELVLGNFDTVSSKIERGSVEIRGRVSSTNNGTEFVFVDGYKGYFYSDAEGLREINDENFYPSNAVAQLDTFFIFNRRGTGQFFIARGDTFDGTEFASASGAPDDTITLLVDHRELWLFGETSIEIWYNSGAADFPLERLQGAFIEKGIAGPHLADKADNSVYWVGNDRIVYRANGYQPLRISTHAVEFDLDRSTNLEESTFFTYTQEGHIFFCLNIKDLGKTWVFDVATGQWHERGTDKYGRFPADIAASQNQNTYVGHFDLPEVSRFDLDYPFVEDELLLREAILPPLFDNTNRIKFTNFELRLDVPTIGTAPVPESCSDVWELPEEYVSLSWADDGGEFGYEDRQGFGAYGIPDERIDWWKLGSSYDRSFRLRIRTTQKVALTGAYRR